MSSGTVRRRLHHGEVKGRKSERFDSTGYDGLNEPLLYHRLSSSSHNDLDVDEDEGYWRERGANPELAWKRNLSQLLAQWSQCVTNVVIGPGSLLGVFIYRCSGKRQGTGEKVVVGNLSPLQEERLRKLQLRLQVPFDGTRLDHQEALKGLWKAAFPDIELRGLKSEQWKDMGWQGSDPTTDFRGGGFVSLENLLFFAQMFPKSFHRLLFKQEGKRATWEYPFAVAGINVSFMLIQMLDLCSDKPKSPSGINFLKILAEDEMAFDLLYCVAFEMIDAQWLAMHASYMEFNEVLKAARAQLERELSLEDINQIQDLPAYNLLYQ